MKAVRKILFYGFLGVGPSVFAGSMGQVCEGQDVTVPCVATSWGIEAHALYLQPHENGIETAQDIQTISGSLSEGVKARWKWGFQVGGILAWGTGSDFVWNWYNYRNSNNLSSLDSPAYLGTLINGGGEETETVHQLQINELDYNKSVQWDQVNFEVGQNIDITSDVHFRPHADVQVARIANFVTSLREGSSLERGDFLMGQRWASSFTGGGARIGSELAYQDESGFGIFAQAASGLLVGPSKSHIYLVDELSSTVNIYSTSAIPVVANFDAKLGGRLQLEMAQGLFNLDVGWMWNAYMNPLMIYSHYDAPTQTDFSIQGLYFGLKWVGTIA